MKDTEQFLTLLNDPPPGEVVSTAAVQQELSAFAALGTALGATPVAR